MTFILSHRLRRCFQSENLRASPHVRQDSPSFSENCGEIATCKVKGVAFYGWKVALIKNRSHQKGTRSQAANGDFRLIQKALQGARPAEPNLSQSPLMVEKPLIARFAFGL